MNIKRPILRLDIVSRTMLEQSTLIRIVKTKDNQIKIDLNHEFNGRGAYLKKDIASIKFAQKRNLIARALRFKVEDEVYEQLLNMLEN